MSAPSCECYKTCPAVESARRYDAFLRSSPDMMAFVRRDGTYIDLHPGRDIEPLVPLEMLKGKKIGDLVPHVKDDFMRAIAHALDSGREVSFHFEIPGRGDVYEARINRSSPDEVLIISRDVTKQRLTQQRLEAEVQQRTSELQRSNNELAQFAYAASHDLREPALKVKAFGNLLRENLSHEKLGPGVDEKVGQYLGVMLSAADRMIILIDDLLAYSRVGRKDGEIEVIPLQQVLQGVLADLAVRIQEADAYVEMGPLPTVCVDAVQMQVVAQNLISNSLKFRRTGIRPHISISAEKPSKGFVVVQVVDNGIGFEQKYADRIFQIFERLHTRHDYPGTGIGLALCKRIVERHGGWIEAMGRPGEGSTFRFTIPVLEGKK